jgi:hypothetical protein
MFNNLLPLVGILVVFVIVAVVFKILLAKGKQGPQDYPYEKEPAPFSPAERSFLGVLEQAVNGRYRFMGKVRLADVVRVKTGMSGSARQSAFNRIQSKHIDFVACDPATLMVQFAVELDDETHRQSKRQLRDEIVDRVLEAAGIPIFHFVAKRAYSVQDVQVVLSEMKALSKK